MQPAFFPYMLYKPLRALPLSTPPLCIPALCIPALADEATYMCQLSSRMPP